VPVLSCWYYRAAWMALRRPAAAVTQLKDKSGLVVKMAYDSATGASAMTSRRGRGLWVSPQAGCEGRSHRPNGTGRVADSSRAPPGCCFKRRTPEGETAHDGYETGLAQTPGIHGVPPGDAPRRNTWCAPTRVVAGGLEGPLRASCRRRGSAGAEKSLCGFSLRFHRHGHEAGRPRLSP
jgi:hypothetical protein